MEPHLTLGSGDVLAGIIVSLIGRESAARRLSKEELMPAVLNAVYLHGAAGTACLEKMAEDSVTAGDIISSLESTIKEIRDEQKGVKP